MTFTSDKFTGEVRGKEREHLARKERSEKEQRDRERHPAGGSKQ